VSDKSDEVLSVLEDEAREALLLAADDAVEELQGDGLDKDDALEIVFNILDGILAFKELGSLAGSAIGGPMGGVAGNAIGTGAEALSDTALAKAEAKLKELERDPVRMEGRAAAAEAAGKTRKAKRIRKRAARVRARQSG